jgi:lysophospholipase L1-like esterase
VGVDHTRRLADGSDGLHLTSEGYRVLFDRLMETIAESLPELDPSKVLRRMSE